jgi:cell division cycle 20-like protein 1 (cofactor of APC complex)
MAEGPRQGK